MVSSEDFYLNEEETGRSYEISLKDLAQRLDHELSCEEIFYDPVLLDLLEFSDEGWVDISDLVSAISGRMGQLDDAVIEKAIRNYSDYLKVSEDGQSVKISVDLSQYDDLNNRTVHIELPEKVITGKRVEKLVSGIGKIEKIRILDAGPARVSNRVPYKYAVVTLGSEDEASRLSEIYDISKYQHRIGMGSNAIIRDAFQQAPVVYLRSKWQELFREYKALRISKTLELRSIMKEKIGKSNKSKFGDSASLLEFENVNRGTNSKILKYLFELFAPVSFVDYERGSTKGVVRYKTTAGVSHTVAFLSNHEIVQRHEYNTGDLLGYRSFEENLGFTKPIPIAVRPMPEDKAVEYLRRITERGKKIEVKKVKKIEDEKEATHIFFDNSDSSE